MRRTKGPARCRALSLLVAARSSMERDAQSQIDDGMLDRGDDGHAIVAHIAVRAEVEVPGWRDRDVASDADVIPQTGEESKAVPRGGPAVADLVRGVADATLQEEARLRLGIEVQRRGDVPHGLRRPAHVLHPRVDLSAQQHALAERAAQLDVPRGTAALEVVVEGAPAPAGQIG